MKATKHTLLAGGLLIAIGMMLPLAGTMAQGGYMPYGYGQGYASPRPYYMPVMPPHPAYGGYGSVPGYGYGPYGQPFGGYYPPQSDYKIVPHPTQQGMSGMQGMSDAEGMSGMQSMSGMQGMSGQQGMGDAEGMSGMQGAEALLAIPLLRGMMGTYRISPSGEILLYPIASEPAAAPTAKDSTETGTQ